MRTERTQEYKGYSITPLPPIERDGGFYGGYEIDKDGAPVSRRTELFPVLQYESAALTESIEHAKIEIDNLLQTGSPEGEAS